MVQPGVVAGRDTSKEEINDKTPVAPIDLTKDLACPLIGIFGNDERLPGDIPLLALLVGAAMRKRLLARYCGSWATTETSVAELSAELSRIKSS